MWMQFFAICDFLCNFIPGRHRRAMVRQKYLYDWRKKYRALRHTFPELSFRHVKMIKGGWNIGFIIDHKYVFKIRKFYDKTVPADKIVREVRLTNALAPVASVRIPCVNVVHADQYTFYKYDFIPGRNMNTFSAATIARYAPVWGAQIGEFIHSIHTASPMDLDDLRDGPGDGWNHNDICNNVIINPKTMRVAGIIDWEYSGWGLSSVEFENSVIFSKKIKASGILAHIQKKYNDLDKSCQGIDISSAA